MSTIEKLLEKFKNLSSKITFNELIRILNYYGYFEFKAGKTSGSRQKFRNSENSIITIHKPHPNNEIPVYVIKQLKEKLQ